MTAQEICTMLKVSKEIPLYQPIEMPDFDGWPVLQPCVERWNLIKSYLPNAKGTALDVGCHTGWFCRRLSHEGWRAIGFEQSSDLVQIAESLNSFSGPIKPFYFVKDILQDKIPFCSVTLCLSIAMYLFDDVEAGWQAFDRISAASDVMFLDFGGMYSDRLPFDEFTVEDMMFERTEFSSSQKLGYTDFESRPLFMFWK